MHPYQPTLDFTFIILLPLMKRLVLCLNGIYAKPVTCRKGLVTFTVRGPPFDFRGGGIKVGSVIFFRRRSLFVCLFLFSLFCFVLFFVLFCFVFVCFCFTPQIDEVIF